MLLVFSDDWGRHPSSCQHLIQQLLPRQRVTWVNTIGMRTPGFNRATLRRAAERFGQWLRPQPRAPEAQRGSSLQSMNPRVLNPRMWPWFSRQHDRWLNRGLLTRALKPVVQQAGEEVHAITSIPVVADIMTTLPVASWTYYCVDDFGSWPGLDQVTMERLERDVIARADRLIAASEALQERIRDRGRTAELLTHGVDLPFWQSPATEPLPPEMLSLPRPWVVFWGLRDPRLNADWLATLARDLAHGTILLVGPSDQPPELLRSLPRVIEWPAFAFERLPALGQAADVLVMPYADLPVTRAMQPLKLKEYLATGKPVVVSDLPATRTWSDCLDVATGAAEFSSLVRERARGGVPAEQQIARRRLAAEGWSAKAGQFEQWILFGTTPSASDGNR